MFEQITACVQTMGITEEVQLKFWKFSGGEVGVEITNLEEVTSSLEQQSIEGPIIGKVTSYIRSSDELMATALTVNAISSNFNLREKSKVKGKFTIGNGVVLNCPYIPYARQDKAKPGESLSLEVFAGIINSLYCYKVIAFDPHSSYCFSSIDRLTVVKNLYKKELQKAMKEIGFDLDSKSIQNCRLVKPDQGATERTAVAATSLGISSCVQGLKVRGEKGKIESLKLRPSEGYGFIEIKDKDLIIVDDICDGGRTFIEL